MCSGNLIAVDFHRVNNVLLNAAATKLTSIIATDLVSRRLINVAHENGRLLKNRVTFNMSHATILLLIHIYIDSKG